MSTRGFLIEVLLHINNVQQAKVISVFFIKLLHTLHLKIFVPNVFNKGNHPETQDKHFMSRF